MIKRYLSICVLAITLMLMFPVIAYADYIWTPSDDFYDNNQNKCDNLGRTFYANGVRGYVSVKKEPGSNSEIGAITNGLKYYVYSTYDLGDERWGLIMPDAWSIAPPIGVHTGWVLMDQLVLVYDNISFDEEHGNEFYVCSGDYAALFEVDELVFWRWPGSGEIAMVHDDPADRSREPARSWLAPTSAYMDSEGREWGKIPYFYASRYMWVCLSDPGNSDIPVFNPAPIPELYPPADPGELSTQGIWISEYLTTIIIVAVLVIGAAVLIRILWKPKNES